MTSEQRIIWLSEKKFMKAMEVPRRRESRKYTSVWDITGSGRNKLTIYKNTSSLLGDQKRPARCCRIIVRPEIVADLKDLQRGKEAILVCEKKCINYYFILNFFFFTHMISIEKHLYVVQDK